MSSEYAQHLCRVWRSHSSLVHWKLSTFNRSWLGWFDWKNCLRSANEIRQNKRCWELPRQGARSDRAKIECCGGPIPCGPAELPNELKSCKVKASTLAKTSLFTSGIQTGDWTFGPWSRIHIPKLEPCEITTVVLRSLNKPYPLVPIDLTKTLKTDPKQFQANLESATSQHSVICKVNLHQGLILRCFESLFVIVASIFWCCLGTAP